MNLPALIRGAERGFHPLVRLLDRMTWVILFFMMLLTMGDVFLRKFLNRSILGSVEITELLMVVVVFGAIAQCQIDDGHIQVDLVLKRLRPRFRRMCIFITQFLSSLLFGGMTWATVQHAREMQEWGEVTLDLGWPIYPFVAVVALGCLLLTLVLLLRTLMALNRVLDS